MFVDVKIIQTVREDVKKYSASSSTADTAQEAA